MTVRACSEAVTHCDGTFPISAVLFSELSKIQNHRQRRDLREVIEPLSRYMVLTHLALVTEHEVEALLDNLIGPNPEPLGSIRFLDWGIDKAFGYASDLRVKTDTGEDVTDSIRRSFPGGPQAFDDLRLRAAWAVNRMAIEGPTPLEEPELRKFGWNPNAILRLYDQNVEEEIQQSQRFDTIEKFRRGRTRDVIAARELLLEQKEFLVKGLAKRGPGAEDEFFGENGHDLVASVNSMPSFDVSVTLKTTTPGRQLQMEQQRPL